MDFRLIALFSIIFSAAPTWAARSHPICELSKSYSGSTTTTAADAREKPNLVASCAHTAWKLEGLEMGSLGGVYSASFEFNGKSLQGSYEIQDNDNGKPIPSQFVATINAGAVPANGETAYIARLKIDAQTHKILAVQLYQRREVPANGHRDIPQLPTYSTPTYSTTAVVDGACVAGFNEGVSIALPVQYFFRTAKGTP